MNLDMFPIAPMLISLIIPIIYCLKWKKESLKKILVISICSILIVLLYPLVNYLSQIEPNTGYFFGKLILFTVLPLIFLIFLEKWKIKDALLNLGIRKKNLGKSIIYGLGVLIITVIIVMVIFWNAEGITSVTWNIIMFLEAFNEEFFFRGILLLYLWKITDIKIAYITSVFAFLLAHPQHLSSISFVGTLVQGILLAFVTYKTKNIIGPWFSHGLNRVIPQLFRIIF